MCLPFKQRIASNVRRGSGLAYASKTRPQLISTALPPHPERVGEEQARDDEDRGPEHPVALVLRERDAAIGRFSRADRDQVFLLREPVAHVQAEVAVASGVDRTVRDEVAVTDDDET